MFELEYDPIVDQLCGATAAALAPNAYDDLARDHAKRLVRAGRGPVTLSHIDLTSGTTTWWSEDQGVVRYTVVQGGPA